MYYCFLVTTIVRCHLTHCFNVDIERLATLCHGQCNHSGRTVSTPADLLWSIIPSADLPSFLEELEGMRELSMQNPLDIDALIRSSAEYLQDDSVEFVGPLSIAAGHKESQKFNEWMSVDKAGSNDLPMYAYPHAPPLPDKHSYKQTAVYVPRETDPAIVRQKAVEKNEFVQTSLKKLIKACDGSIVDIFSVVPTSTAIDDANTSAVIDMTKDSGSRKLKLPTIHYERFRAQQQRRK